MAPLFCLASLVCPFLNKFEYEIKASQLVSLSLRRSGSKAFCTSQLIRLIATSYLSNIFPSYLFYPSDPFKFPEAQNSPLNELYKVQKLRLTYCEALNL